MSQGEIGAGLLAQVCDESINLVRRGDAEVSHACDVALVKDQHGVVAAAGMGQLNGELPGLLAIGILDKHEVNQILRLPVAVHAVRQPGRVNARRQEDLVQCGPAFLDPLPGKGSQIRTPLDPGEGL
jgi:hypothetical protein